MSNFLVEQRWHDDNYPHGDKHTNKHDKDGEYNFQIIETKRSFTYDADGKLLTVSEDEDRQGHYDYEMTYDDMGNRTSYTKSRNGKVVESGEYTYNLSNQLVSAKLYDGKKNTTMEYTYDADGNLIGENGKIGTDKVEKDYIYTVENRLKAVYDGDGNRIFQLNYNLHTDDDWKGNSGNGNGNNKDNSGSGKSLWSMIVDFFTGGDEEESIAETAEAETVAEAESTERMNPEATPSTFKLNDNGNNGNNGNGGNGNHYGWESGDGEDLEPEDPDAGSTDEGENGSGNTNNTGGSQNQSGILFPEEGEVSELEDELIGMIKTSGHEKNYELIEYVNDVNRENAEVLMELNINGKMDTAYSYGNERLTVERFDGWTGYYTYDPRGSVSGVTGSDGYLWQSYRYDPFGDISFGKPQYNNVYAYNAESFNPNLDTIYLRARYYYTSTANFLSEDTYLGDISDPLTLNRYNYVKSSYLNYKDPSGESTEATLQGKEAHALMETYLQAVLPGDILTEYNLDRVYDKEGNIKSGRADIVYTGELYWEVYEIKPISNSKGYKYKNAQRQRNSYVDAIAIQGVSINREGQTLNPIVNNVILKSVGWADENLYYRYNTYEDKPGMIFYERVKDPEEVRAYDEQVEKARELLKAGLCEQKEVLQPEIVLDGKTLVTAAGITIVVVGGVAIISWTGGGAAAIAFAL